MGKDGSPQDMMKTIVCDAGPIVHLREADLLSALLIARMDTAGQEVNDDHQVYTPRRETMVLADVLPLKSARIC